MVHSMTAFARVENAGPYGTLSWELRSVNHRYLEPHLRLPEAFRDLEGSVREALRQALARGKVECTLRLAEEGSGKSLQVDRERAAQVVAAAEAVAALIQQPAALNPLEVLAWPGVLVADAADPQALNAAALALFEQALNELKSGRGREGAALAALLEEAVAPGAHGGYAGRRGARRRPGRAARGAPGRDACRGRQPARAGAADARHPVTEDPRPLRRTAGRTGPAAPGAGTGDAGAEE